MVWMPTSVSAVRRSRWLALEGGRPHPCHRRDVELVLLDTVAEELLQQLEAHQRGGGRAAEVSAALGVDDLAAGRLFGYEVADVVSGDVDGEVSTPSSEDSVRSRTDIV
jgi:hypothetical protein